MKGAGLDRKGQKQQEFPKNCWLKVGWELEEDEPTFVSLPESIRTMDREVGRLASPWIFI